MESDPGHRGGLAVEVDDDLGLAVGLRGEAVAGGLDERRVGNLEGDLRGDVAGGVVGVFGNCDQLPVVLDGLEVDGGRARRDEEEQ